ncbi:hypothetical protein L841_0664 [Mycobacterium sp. MAC_080597_8934]|nr:hypothetical protein L841_0664 [Mycobacterium sp. MAC_080597_8934]
MPGQWNTVGAQLVISLRGETIFLDYGRCPCARGSAASR